MVPTVPYAELKGAPKEWQSLQQIQEDLERAVCDQVGGIIIKNEIYPISGIAKQIFALRPNLPEASKKNRTYLAVARKFKEIVDQDSKPHKPWFSVSGALACCCCTSSCKESIVLADAKLTEEELEEWIDDMIHVGASV